MKTESGTSGVWNHRVQPEARSVGLRWHYDNPERAKLAVARFDANNPGRRAALNRAWRAAHPNYKKEWKAKNPERARRHDRSAKLKAAYGITLVQYEAMLSTQGGGCAACGNSPGKKALAVDHDHRTAKVRALLCCGCNTALGSLKESPERLNKLIDYLARF